MSEYDELLPKNENGIRTHLTCELCGFEPKTKNRYRERQDHMLRTHFMHKMTEIFPTFSNFNCPSSDCVFIGKDKQSIMRHYISKHGFIDVCLKEVLAERGIDYVIPGFERAPKKKPGTVTTEVTTQYVTTHEFAEGAEGQGLGDDTIVFVAIDDNQAQAFESSAFESVEDNEKHQNQKVVGHISVGDGMVGTIALLDPQQMQEEEESREKKRKSRAPYQTQFANLNLTTEEKRKRKRRKRRPSPDPNETPKAKVLRKILEKNSDLDSDSDDSDSDLSGIEDPDIPASERRAIKEARNSRLLQLLVIDLERENASLKKENKTLRARVDVLLDIMAEQQQHGVLTSKLLQRVDSSHSFQNVTLISDATRAARFQHQQMMRQQKMQSDGNQIQNEEEIDLTQSASGSDQENADDDNDNEIEETVEIQVHPSSVEVGEKSEEMLESIE